MRDLAAHQQEEAEDPRRTEVRGWCARIEAGESYRQVAADVGVNASTILRCIRKLKAGKYDPAARPSGQKERPIRPRRVALPKSPWNVNLHRKRLDALLEPWIDSAALDPERAESDRRVAALLRTGFTITEVAWLMDTSRATIKRASERLGIAAAVEAAGYQNRAFRQVSDLRIDRDLVERLMQPRQDRQSLEAVVGDMKPLEAVEHLLFVLGELLWTPARHSRSPHPKLKLTDREAAVLFALWRAKGKSVHRQTIWTSIYAADLDDGPRVQLIAVYVTKLRAKIARAKLPLDIVTVWGVGYALRCPDRSLLNWTRLDKDTMHLTLSPIRGLPGQPETTLSVAGEVLTCDGVAYDLSPVPEGGRATPSGDDHPFIGAITREDGVIRATLRVVLGDDAAPDQPASPWVIGAGDGPVTIPAARIEEPEA